MTSIRDFVVGGSCDFCGAVVGNPHEPACPTINKEKMTDKKDIVEEAKLALSYYEKDDPEWPVYLVTRLIHEVEKLRSSNMVKEVAIGEYVKKIDSLTKERDELKVKLDHWYKEAGEQTDARWRNAKEKQKLKTEDIHE